MVRHSLSERDRNFLERHRALGRRDDNDVRGSAELVEVSGEIKRVSKSGDAYLFFDGARTEWVPKSQVAIVTGGLQMPEWLAKKKGFI